MLRQLLVGATVVQMSSRIAGAKHAAWQSLPLTIMIAVASTAAVPILIVAHFSEVMVWSLAYLIVHAAPAGADPVYFAFVNYTTLGYGDVTPVERWRLLVWFVRPPSYSR